MTKPTIPEVLPKVQEYYKDHLAGGNLHIVLDDGNVRDSDVMFCLERAKQKNDIKGIELANLLLRMSTTQRRKLYANH